MSSDFESGPHVTDVEKLPRPGAVQLYFHEWVPTIDGEPISEPYPLSYFRSREQALAEAIKCVKHRAGLAFEVKIESRAGCCLSGEIPVIVETVAEAREVIVSYARGMLGGYASDPEQREHLRLKTRRGRSTWKSLAECETSRHYDPIDPDAGMTCSYLLYDEGGLEGVGGMIWTYGVEIWVTAPPAVWDHPAHQPIGLDNAGDPDNDLEPGCDSDSRSQARKRAT